MDFAEEFQVAKEGSGAGSADIVCYQKSLSLKCCACCSCLAARGCAEIQDSVTRLDGDAGGWGHGAGFLKVVEAGLVVWASGRTDVFIVEVAVFDPWDLTGWKWRQVFEVFAGDLGGVYAQAVGSGSAEAREECGVFVTEHFFHSGEECGVEVCCIFVHNGLGSFAVVLIGGWGTRRKIYLSECGFGI